MLTGTEVKSNGDDSPVLSMDIPKCFFYNNYQSLELMTYLA